MRHHDIIHCWSLPVSHYAQTVINVLAVMANVDTLEAWTTVPKLMEATKSSKSSIQRGIRELEALKIITVQRASGRHHYSTFILNGIYQTPLNSGVSQTPLSETDNSKGVSQTSKGVSQTSKGVSQTPKSNIKNIKNSAHIHAHGKQKEPAVNRPDGAGGVLPQFDETTSIEAREAWSSCLQGKTGRFRVPDSAILGPIHAGRAMITNLTGVQRDQIIQNTEHYIAEKLSNHYGERIDMTLLMKAKEKAA